MAGLIASNARYLAGITQRTTLVAVPDAHGFRFDIRLQGEGETVFLTYPRH